MMKDSIMKRYLLGGLTTEERAKLEEQYFADPDRFEELCAIENDLIDVYVLGRLSDAEREQFENQYYGSPDRQARVEFARALNQVSHGANDTNHATDKVSFLGSLRAIFSQPRPSLQWAALTVAIIIIVGGGSFFTIQNRRLHAELNRAEAAQDDLRRTEESLRRQVAAIGQHAVQKPPDNGQSAQVAQLESLKLPEVTFALAPVARGGEHGQNVLLLPSANSWIRLKLKTDGERYANYQAVLRTANGDEIGRADRLAISPIASGERAVVWRISSRLVGEGDYIISLDGIAKDGTKQEIEEYSFRATKH